MCTFQTARAEALTITPADAIEIIWPTSDCEDPPNAENELECVANTFGEDPDDLTLLYKANQGADADSGDFADDYTSAIGETGGTITWDGPDAIECPACYLFIKDGDGSPRYLYDLSAWDGEETITLSGFYLGGGPSSGGISHVSIYGAEGEPCEDCEPPVIPEPASLVLLGSGLIGLAAARRRKKQNKVS